MERWRARTRPERSRAILTAIYLLQESSLCRQSCCMVKIACYMLPGCRHSAGDVLHAVIRQLQSCSNL
jgi:hypothetical protein